MSAEPYRVLVVEDNAIMRRFLVRTLEAGGFTATQAGDADQALAAARLETPHAVVLDLELPRVDGLEVLCRFRAQGSFERVPIVVFTGNWDEEQRRRCLESGADEYLRKGDVDLTAVPAILLCALRRRRGV